MALMDIRKKRIGGAEPILASELPAGFQMLPEKVRPSRQRGTNVVDRATSLISGMKKKPPGMGWEQWAEKNLTPNEYERYQTEQAEQAQVREAEWAAQDALRAKEQAAEDARWIKTHGAVPGTPKWYEMIGKQNLEERKRRELGDIITQINELERRSGPSGARGIDTPKGKAEYNRLMRKRGLLGYDSGYKAGKREPPPSQVAKADALEKRHASLSEELDGIIRGNRESMEGLQEYIYQNAEKVEDFKPTTRFPTPEDFLAAEYTNQLRRELKKTEDAMDALTQRPTARTTAPRRQVRRPARKAAGEKPLPSDLFRPDGTRKGPGFLGTLKRPDGGVSTELSVGVEFDGEERLIPLLVPTLTKKQINHLLTGKKLTDAIFKKAVGHAKKRMSEGKSVFAEEKAAKPTAPDRSPDMAIDIIANKMKSGEQRNAAINAFRREYPDRVKDLSKSIVATIPKKDKDMTVAEFTTELVDRGVGNKKQIARVGKLLEKDLEGGLTIDVESFKKALKKAGIAYTWTDQQLNDILLDIGNRLGAIGNWIIETVGTVKIPGTEALR